MTLEKLALFTRSPIKVMSGFNDKVLAKRYDSERHSHIANREVVSIWSEVALSNSGGFSQYIHPIICVHVNGHEEYVKEMARRADNG